MNLKQATSALEYAIQADIPCMLWGEPGVGKSAIVKQIATNEKVELLDIRLSQIESIDLRGIPALKGDKTVWNIPEYMPSDPDSEGILFLDEINQGSPSTQAASYQLILDRKIGEYSLPPRWRIIAAGNPGADRISSALANRFMHLDVQPEIRDWTAWALDNNINPSVIGFANARPTCLRNKISITEDYAYASPRTLEYLSDMLGINPAPVMLPHLVSGLIGKGMGIEYMAYVNTTEHMATIDAILAEPTRYDYSGNPSQMYATLMLTFTHLDARNISTLFQYINTFPLDFQALIITMINTNKNSLMGTSVVTDWCVRNPSLL